MQVDLEHKEILLIKAALEAVSPTGGGSPQFSLLMKINSQYPNSEEDFDKYNKMTIQLCEVVLNEFRQSQD